MSCKRLLSGLAVVVSMLAMAGTAGAAGPVTLTLPGNGGAGCLDSDGVLSTFVRAEGRILNPPGVQAVTYRVRRVGIEGAIPPGPFFAQAFVQEIRAAYNPELFPNAFRVCARNDNPEALKVVLTLTGY
jgi:hypothetical protein